MNYKKGKVFLRTKKNHLDILKEIEEQISSIKKVDNSSYLDAIMTHLGRAEFYYKQGKNDSSYFNEFIGVIKHMKEL